MRLLVTVLLASHVLFGHVRELSADETIPAEKRELVVTVLDKPIYLDQITPREAAAKRKELSDVDYQRWLRAYRAGRLVSSVSGSVLKEYAIREKLTPSDEEIDTLIAEAERKQAETIEGDKEARQKLALQAFWVRGSSYEWRTAKALHEKYGGRVAISSFGACTSFEGRNAVLKDYAGAGDIKFHHADLERAFWEKTKDERIQDVTLQPERVKEHFAVAPWERWVRESAQVDSQGSAAGDTGKSKASGVERIMLDHICREAYTQVAALTSLEYTFETKDTEGWHSKTEFHAFKDRFFMKRVDVTGQLVLDKRLDPMTCSSAFDGVRQQYLDANGRLRFKTGVEGAAYTNTTPELAMYMWLRSGPGDWRWDSVRNKELWESRFAEATYVGAIPEEERTLEIVDFPQKVEGLVPCVFRVFFARDLGYAPVKFIRRNAATTETSTVMHVTKFKTVVRGRKEYLVPLSLTVTESGADGVSRKQTLTMTVSGPTINVNDPMVQFLFTIPEAEANEVYDVDLEKALLETKQLDGAKIHPEQRSRRPMKNLVQFVNYYALLTALSIAVFLSISGCATSVQPLATHDVCTDVAGIDGEWTVELSKFGALKEGAKLKVIRRAVGSYDVQITQADVTTSWDGNAVLLGKTVFVDLVPVIEPDTDTLQDSLLLAAHAIFVLHKNEKELTLHGFEHNKLYPLAYKEHLIAAPDKSHRTVLVADSPQLQKFFQQHGSALEVKEPIVVLKRKS